MVRGGGHHHGEGNNGGMFSWGVNFGWNQHRHHNHHHHNNNNRFGNYGFSFLNIGPTYGNTWWNPNQPTLNSYDNSDGCCEGCNDETKEGCAVCFLCLLPLLLFISLLLVSPSNLGFDLTVGNSRRIPIASSMLTKSIEMSYVGSEQGFLYHFPSTCPPLTGPIETIHDSSNLLLYPGDYAYDFYYLNPGSHIEASLRLDESGGELILIRSIVPSQEIEFVNDDDDDDYGYGLSYSNGIPLYKSYTSARNNDASLSYTVKRAGYYYVVYYNMLNQRLQGQTSVSLTLTSFDVTGYFPETTHCKYGGSDCTINFPKGSPIGCLIVSVPQTKNEISSNRTIVIDSNNGNNVSQYATISISRHRRWSMIFLITFTPFIGFLAVRFLGMLISMLNFPLQTQNDIHESPIPTVSSTLSNPEGNPLPTESSTFNYPEENPSYQATNETMYSSTSNTQEISPESIIPEEIPLANAVPIAYSYQTSPSAPSI